MRPRPSPRRRFGSISARRFSKPSAVTRPAATSSHSASSTSLASRPVARTRSAKNDAPRCCELLPGPRAPDATAIRRAASAAPSSSHSASSRRKSEIGATRVGRTRRALVVVVSNAGCGESRPHITSPERQSWSSSSGLVIGDAARQDLGFPRRGGDLVALQLLARSAARRRAPCSCVPGATCCQRRRKRMKSAVVTGSISRRSRPSVRR